MQVLKEFCVLVRKVIRKLCYNHNALENLAQYRFYDFLLLVLIIIFSKQATIGIDFLSKTMYLEDRTVRLQLW